MMAELFRLLGLHKDEIPPDKLQMDAAKDRLAQRGVELEDEVDELTKMVRRMKRQKG